MFGSILTIKKNSAIVSINVEEALNKDLINLHVIFEDASKHILGEIEEIGKDCVTINFIGELDGDTFIPGILRKPSLDAKIRVINDDELRTLVGNDERSISLGVSPLYNSYPIKVKIDDLFAHHTVILGNSGSGKTYGICRIMQNVFNPTNIIPYRANFFIFDSFGEYINAFSELNKVNPYYSLKVITTNPRETKYPLLDLPVCLLSIDDLLNLLDAQEFCQIAMVETAVKLVKMFARNDAESNEYKNHIVAKAINSILYTNQTSARIRDQIFEILSETNTDQLNLNAVVPGIGFTRNFSNCFEIDSEGRFGEFKLITEYINSFIQNDRAWNLDVSNSTLAYSLHDLEKALNFTLYGEKYLLNEKMYNAAISLKVKLHDLATGPYRNFFTNKAYVTSDVYLSSLLKNGNGKAQIINFNLEDIDDRFARTITKIYARMLMKYTRNLKDRASVPMHIILEEAHRYVVENDDRELLGYNIFERIAKEGRKYGMILTLLTQRPTELNDHVISQCANFLIFKITHPLDLEYITKMVPNMSADIVEKQKTLQPGTCVAFGKILKLPWIVKMEKASPPPESANCEVYNKWMVNVTPQQNTQTQQ